MASLSQQNSTRFFQTLISMFLNAGALPGNQQADVTYVLTVGGCAVQAFSFAEQ